MRRLLVLCALAALLSPAAAHAVGGRVTAFYYPWYGTPALDGAYQHWSQNGHDAAGRHRVVVLPGRGVYSSSDRLVIGAADGRDPARPGSTRSPSRGGGAARPRTAACRPSSRPRAQTGSRSRCTSSRTRAGPWLGTVADIAYLERRTASRRSTSTAPFDFPVADWAAAADRAARRRVRRSSRRRRSSARRPRRGSTASTPTTSSRTAASMFAPALQRGTRDGTSSARRRSARLRRAARRRRPTREAAPARARPTTRCGVPRSPRGADRVTITSFNEWHEGTQIEPAAPAGRHGALPLPRRYDGACGLHGVAAETRISTRTRYWSDVFRSTSPAQLKTRAVVDVVLGDAAELRVRRGRRSRPATSSRPSAAAPSPSRSRAASSIGMHAARARSAGARCPSSSRSSSSGSMRTFESRADAQPICAVHDASDRQEAVAEVRLGRRADADARRLRRASRSSSAPSACVACTIVVRGAEAALAREQLDRPQRRARRGTPRSRAAARRRARAAAARAPPRSGRARASASAGHARTEWGATADGDPVAAQRLELAQIRRRRTPAGSAGCRRAGSTRRGRRRRCPPRRLPRPPPAPPRARGSGTRRPP